MPPPGIPAQGPPPAPSVSAPPPSAPPPPAAASPPVVSLVTPDAPSPRYFLTITPPPLLIPQPSVLVPLAYKAALEDDPSRNLTRFLSDAFNSRLSRLSSAATPPSGNPLDRVAGMFSMFDKNQVSNSQLSLFLTGKTFADGTIASMKLGFGFETPLGNLSVNRQASPEFLYRLPMLAPKGGAGDPNPEDKLPRKPVP